MRQTNSEVQLWDNGNELMTRDRLSFPCEQHDMVVYVVRHGDSRRTNLVRSVRRATGNE